MIAFAGMLVEAAQRAGMAVPDNPDDFDPDEFPHFHVYCGSQLGQPLPSWSSHWVNAEIIAKIPEDKIKTITMQELFDLGFEVGTPIP